MNVDKDIRQIVAALLLLTGCGVIPRSPAVPTQSSSEKLIEKVQLYESEIPARLGPSGWIFTEQCDALLFTGLLAAALPELPIDLTAARDIGGAWYRRPLQLPECLAEYEAGRDGSHSTISRDMFTGLLWAMHERKMLPEAEQLLTYARDNNYIMGRGDPARVALMPNLTKLLGDIINTLGGGDLDERRLPTTTSRGLTDYEAHLQVWQIVLDARLNDGVTEEQLRILEQFVVLYPDNPIYQAALHKFTDGDQSVATELLLNGRLWPDDRLPDHRESCDYFPLSRDPAHPDSGYNPCGQRANRAEPNGADLLIIYHLLIK